MKTVQRQRQKERQNTIKETINAHVQSHVNVNLLAVLNTLVGTSEGLEIISFLDPSTIQLSSRNIELTNVIRNQVASTTKPITQSLAVVAAAASGHKKLKLSRSPKSSAAPPQTQSTAIVPFDGGGGAVVAAPRPAKNSITKKQRYPGSGHIPIPDELTNTNKGTAIPQLQAAGGMLALYRCGWIVNGEMVALRFPSGFMERGKVVILNERTEKPTVIFCDIKNGGWTYESGLDWMKARYVEREATGEIEVEDLKTVCQLGLSTECYRFIHVPKLAYASLHQLAFAYAHNNKLSSADVMRMFNKLPALYTTNNTPEISYLKDEVQMYKDKYENLLNLYTELQQQQQQDESQQLQLHPLPAQHLPALLTFPTGLQHHNQYQNYLGGYELGDMFEDLNYTTNNNNNNNNDNTNQIAW